MRMLVSSGFNVIKFERFRKSWSIEYLYSLIDKLWPETKVAAVVKLLLLPFYGIPYVRQMRIVVPFREFFIVIANK